MRRIREVKWPWNETNQSGFISPLRVHGIRQNARFLSLLFIDDDLRLYFEEHQLEPMGPDQHFVILHAHDSHFSEIYDGCDYLASAPIHGNRWVAHVYTVRPAALGAVLNRIQTGLSAERMARAARGRKA